LHVTVLEGAINLMQGITIKKTVLILVLVSAIPLAGCGDDDDTPTSPTQPGPPVTTPPPTTTTPEPTPPPSPTPTPTPTPAVTITGTVTNLERSGAGDLDISFRIDDFTIVRAAGGTPVTAGSQTFNTDAVRNGQTVTVTGTRTNGFLDAAGIDIISAP
jgi:hypothetical protein